MQTGTLNERLSNGPRGGSPLFTSAPEYPQQTNCFIMALSAFLHVETRQHDSPQGAVFAGHNAATRSIPDGGTLYPAIQFAVEPAASCDEAHRAASVGAK